MSNVRTSENFNASDADVIIQSCDGVQFHIHRKYLEANTGAFPPAEFSTKGEVVKLTENARTLNLLFQFVYPKRHPALDSEKFDVLAPLAEAAEKYEVFSAMNICHIRMSAFVSSFPREVIVYACLHDYPNIINQAAPLVMGYPLDTTVAFLPPKFVVPWIRYHQLWLNALQAAVDYQRTPTIACKTQAPSTPSATVSRSSLSFDFSPSFSQSSFRNSPTSGASPFGSFGSASNSSTGATNNSRCSCSSRSDWTPILKELAKGVQSLTRIQTVFQDKTATCASCTPCNDYVTKWKSYVEVEVKKIPKFSTLL